MNYDKNELLERIDNFLNKFGPPGPPPKSHWKWHEPTHRWRNPANWIESDGHDAYIENLSNRDKRIRERMVNYYDSLKNFAHRKRDRMSPTGATFVLGSLNRLNEVIRSASMYNFSDNVKPHIDNVVSAAEKEHEITDSPFTKILVNRAKRLQTFIEENKFDEEEKQESDHYEPGISTATGKELEAHPDMNEEFAKKKPQTRLRFGEGETFDEVAKSDEMDNTRKKLRDNTFRFFTSIKPEYQKQVWNILSQDKSTIIYTEKRWEQEHASLIAQSGGKAKKILGYCDNRGVHLPMSTDDYTILHEMSHLLHGHTYQKNDDTGINPEINKKMREMYNIRKERKSDFISTYAMTNHQEFFAENVSMFINKPSKLKRVDPEMFRFLNDALLQ